MANLHLLALGAVLTVSFLITLLNNTSAEDSHYGNIAECAAGTSGQTSEWYITEVGSLQADCRSPWPPSFEMSCSFAVQVPAQLNLLRILMWTKAYKNNVHFLPKELDVGFRARVVVVCVIAFINSSGIIEYEELRKQELFFRPAMILCGALAYPRTIDFARFRAIADEVDAILMADIAHILGLVATKQHPSPFERCDVATMTTHKSLRDPGAGMIT